MTRPVAEILAKAQREGWPTSLIDAIANHHLCGGRADHGDNCSAGHAAPRGGGYSDARQDAAPLRAAGAASIFTSIEGTLMGKPTPEELEQLQAAIASSGDQSGLLEIYGLATGQTQGPEEED